MSKPVELLITNTLHEVAERSADQPIALDLLSNHAEGCACLARTVLRDLADEARPEVLAKMLAAVGVTGGLTELNQRFKAVLDSRTADDTAFGVAPKTDTKKSAVHSVALGTFIASLGNAIAERAKAAAAEEEKGAADVSNPSPDNDTEAAPEATAEPAPAAAE